MSALDYLKAKAKKLELVLNIADRCYHFKTYKKTFLGTDAMLKIITCGFAKSESEAIEFGNKLIQAGIIAHVNAEHNFKNEDLFYHYIMKLDEAKDLDTLNKEKEKEESITSYPQSPGSSFIVDSAYNVPEFVVSASPIQNNIYIKRQISEDEDLYNNYEHDGGDYKQNQINHLLSPTPSGNTPNGYDESNNINQKQTISALQNKIDLLTQKFEKLETMMTEMNIKNMIEIEGGMETGAITTKGLKINENDSCVDKTPLLLNNWRPFDEQYSNFKVVKINQIVYLQGCLCNGKNDICELPKDCRPRGMCTFMFDQHGDKNGRLRISREGNVIVEFQSKNWVYLDGISFICHSPDQKGNDDQKDNVLDVTPLLQNGWSNCGGGYSPFQVLKIGNVVHIQGRIKGGNQGSNITRLNKGCWPNGMMTFAFDQHGSPNGRLRIMKNGFIIPQFMSKDYVYLDGISFVVSNE